MSEQQQSMVQTNLQETPFNGPNPLQYTSRMVLQDGDNSQPVSINSFTVRENKPIPDLNVSGLAGTPVLPHDMKKYQTKRSEYQSVYEDEQDSSNGKPQFLKLIIAKSLQTNFINNLWNKSYLRKLHQLSQYQIETLDDLQFESEIDTQKDDDSLLNQLRQLKLNVFTPYSKFIVVWDLFQILTYLLIFFWLPYKISFQLDYIDDLFGMQSDANIEWLFLCLLASDVAVGCNLAFIHKGQIIKDRSRIIVHYFKTYAFVDLVSLTTISVQFFIPGVSAQDSNMIVFQVILGAIFYILRITKINKILAQIQEFFNLNGSLNDIVALLKLSMVIIFIAHICACTWHGVGYYNQGFSWLDFYEVRSASNGTKYNKSIYWATMTMTTVGYGDITPQNNTEILLNNITMFISSIVFAYSVNSIGIFVSNMYRSTMEYSRSVTLINTFMSKNRIKFELQTRIRSYLEYIWQEEQKMNDEEVGQIIDKLSTHLQDELKFQIKVNILKDCQVMIKSFSQMMIKTLLGYMEEINYSPEEKIFSQNQIDDCSLYIISKGEVEIMYEECNGFGERMQHKSLKFLYQGNYFGEVAFFTDQPRKATAISRGFTKVFKIKKEYFLKVLQGFQNDKEKYHEIRHLVFSGDYSALMNTCYSCQSRFHLVNQCHFLHYCPDKEAKLKKELYPIFQQREYFERRHGKSNCWRDHFEITSRAKDCMQEFYLNSKGTEIEDYESHSNIVNDFEDDSRIDNEVPSSLNYRSNSRTFSRVSQKPELHQEQDDHLQQYMRKGHNQRQTLQTAGFGGAQSLKDKNNSSDYNNRSEWDSSDDSSEEQDKVLVNLPAPIPQQQSKERASNQKITFISKDLQEDVVPRQPSLRSKTYERRSHERTLTPEKQTSEIEIISRHQVKRMTNAKKHTVNNTQNNNTYVNNEDKNFTSMMDNQTVNNQLNPTTTHTQQYIYQHFDKMEIFQNYFTLNNYDQIIRRYARAQRYFGKKRLYPESSVYSFFFMTIKKGWKLRKLGEKGKAAFHSMKTFRKPPRRQIISIKDFGN